METKKLDASTWSSYFDAMTSQLEGKEALVEVASLDLGDQVEADWIPLLGISYEPEAHFVDVIVKGMDHRIQNPKDISVVWDSGKLQAIEIVDDENRQQIVRLREPMRLPAS